MVDERKEKDDSSNVINLVNFTQKYEQSVEFKKWFLYIDNLISNLQESGQTLNGIYWCHSI